mmetsp:Transcript_39264/g.37690  ORF Transcript_39264/g.37690 Transcript_39264/m.37690 type:complete len:157 (+) Transcript_39264:454-924(+)
MVLTMFAYTFVLEQLKQVLVLSLIYMVVVRRFMHLSINEKDYLTPEILTAPKTEDQIPRLKLFCLKVLESAFFETFSFTLITIYTLFIFFWLTLADLVGVTDEVLAAIDQNFLYIFLAEILLKTFASNFMYLMDFFNCFDSVIVVASLILGIMGII